MDTFGKVIGETAGPVLLFLAAACAFAAGWWWAAIPMLWLGSDQAGQAFGRLIDGNENEE